MRGLKLFLLGASCACAFSCNQKNPESKEGFTEIPSMSHPASATYKIEGAKVPYCLWYDPQKWLITYTPFYTEDREKSEWDWILVLIDPKERPLLSENTPTRGTIVLLYSDTEKKRTEEEIKKRVQQSLLKGKQLEEFADLGSGERLVNGFKVFTWKFKTKFPGLGHRIFYNYYYSGEYGSVSLVTLTNLKDWNANEKDVEDLLNGFCMVLKK